mgnify:CR=1 FL=1
MDFSGMVVMLISCCFVAFVPPIIAGVVWVAIYAVCKIRGTYISKSKWQILFLILYILSVIASCFYTNFFWMQDIYVM